MNGREPVESETRLAEAAAWRTLLTEIEAETTPEFEAWLNLSGSHDAWARVSGPWDYLGDHAHEPALVAARQAALGHAKRTTMKRARPQNWRLFAASVAAVIVISFAVWGGAWWLGKPDNYATAFGERRVVTLEDGSKVSLDSNTEVTVRYTKNSRELQLLHGQARFDVARDVERPFSVVAGDHKVIATGTAFNIDMAGPNVVVTLIEGHVVVLDAAPASRSPPPARRVTPHPRTVELKAGQQLAALPRQAPVVASANIQRVTAWTNGQLMFDNEPLSTVVARVNRYTSTPIVIDDPEVAAMRISGVFNTGDVPGFVDTVTRYLPLRAERRESGVVDLKPKG